MAFQSVPSETLIRSIIQTVPPPPALVAVARFTYAPGSFFPPAAGAGPVVFHMETGMLQFQAQGPVFYTRGGQAEPGAPREMPAGVQFEVSPGDQLLVPGNTTHSVRCISSTQAQILGFAIFPQVPPQQFPQGIEFLPLVLGMAGALPKSPLSVALDRRTYPINAARSHSYGGPSLTYVEAGSLHVKVSSGSGQISRSQSAGPFAPPEQVAVGQEIVLARGDGLLLQPGAAVDLSNTGSAPAIVLEAVAQSQTDVNRALARQFFYDALGAGNLALVDSIFTSGFVNHNLLPGQKPSREGIRQMITCWRNAFADASISVDLCVSEGERIATRWTFRGTHNNKFLGIEPKRSTVAISGISVFEIQAAKIAGAWTQVNLASLLIQEQLV